MTSKNENFVNKCLAFMRDVGLVTDNNINYYSPLLGKEEWFVIIWCGGDVRVINDVYIADNACTVCTTNARPVKTFKAFKEKVTSAIKKSKKMTVHLRKRTINKDFVNEDE